jgi:hypothetical protein
MIWLTWRQFRPQAIVAGASLTVRRQWQRGSHDVMEAPWLL